MKIRTFGLLILASLILAGNPSLRGQESGESTPAEEAADAAAGSSANESEAVEVEETVTVPADAEVKTAIDEAEPAMEVTADEAAAAGEATPEPESTPAEEEISDATAVEETTTVDEAPVEDAAADEDVVAAPEEEVISIEDTLGVPMDQEGLPTAEGTDIPNPDELLPEDVYTPGVDDIAPPPPAITENEFETDRRLSIRYQEVKLQALKDEAIRAMREKADAARTDEDKRQALREYYNMLFARMVEIAPELEEKCHLMKTAYLRRVSQFRVAPTIPLNPPPTPEPLPGRADSTPPEPDQSEG